MCVWCVFGVCVWGVFDVRSVCVCAFGECVFGVRVWCVFLERVCV